VVTDDVGKEDGRSERLKGWERIRKTTFDERAENGRQDERCRGQNTKCWE
jgi:hypothetical protein